MKQKPQTNLASKYRFSSLLKNPLAWISFLHDLYKHEKITEATSFLIWELFHILKIFDRADYLIFEKLDLDSTHKNLASNSSSSSEIIFFEGRNRLEKTLDGWKNIFIHINEINGKKIYYQSLSSDSRQLYRLDLSVSEQPCFIALFDTQITCIFVSNQNTIFVCTTGTIYHSNDGGASFQESLKLSNPESWVLPLTGITETPFGTVIIGEYGSIWDARRGRWLTIPYLYYTSDRGVTWKIINFLIEQGINKHVHIIRYCKFANKLILTDGDNKKKLWISDPIISADLEKLKWNLFNRFHWQMGGHTSTIEIDGKIIFGTDYLGGTNFIIETDDFRIMRRKIIPDPYRRSFVQSMTKIKSEDREQIWISLKSSRPNSKDSILYTNNGGKTWNKYIEYDGSVFSISFCCLSNQDLSELYFNIENFQDRSMSSYKYIEQKAYGSKFSTVQMKSKVTK